MPQRGSPLRTLLSSATLLVGGAAALPAQQPRWPGPGTQVRLVAPAASADTIHGRIGRLTESGIVVETRSGRERHVPYEAVLRLDTAVYGSYGRPVLYGALGGAAFATILGAAFTGLASDFASEAELAVRIGGVGAVAGGLFGALYGARSVREWRPIDVDGARRGRGTADLRRRPPGW